MTVRTINTRIFDLTDALGNKNIDKSISILNDLIYNKEPVQKILIMLYSHFRRLYIVCLSQKYNENILQNLNLKPNQTFLIDKYKMQARYFTETMLRQILNEFYNLDVNSKQGKIDLNLGLEAILCNYCSK